MPVTGLNTAKINVALSNFSYEIHQMSGFVGERLFPVVYVRKETGIFWKRGTELLQDNIETLRADGAEANIIKLAYTQDTFALAEYALQLPITDRERNDVDDQISLEQDGIAKLRNTIAAGHETRVNSAMMTYTNFTLSNYSDPTYKWNAASTTIEKDIDTAKTTIEGNSGVTPNTIVIPPAIARTLKRQPEIRELRKETNSELLVNGDLPPVLWNLRVVIPGAIEDQQKYAAGTASLAKIWDDNSVWIGYVNPNPGLRSVCFGVTFRLPLVGHTPDRVMEWRDDPKHTDLYELSVIDVVKIVDNGCGFLYTNVF